MFRFCCKKYLSILHNENTFDHTRLVSWSNPVWLVFTSCLKWKIFSIKFSIIQKQMIKRFHSSKMHHRPVAHFYLVVSLVDHICIKQNTAHRLLTKRTWWTACSSCSECKSLYKEKIQRIQQSLSILDFQHSVFSMKLYE